MDWTETETLTAKLVETARETGTETARETDTETARETETETARELDTETDRETDMETATETEDEEVTGNSVSPGDETAGTVNRDSNQQIHIYKANNRFNDAILLVCQTNKTKTQNLPPKKNCLG